MTERGEAGGGTATGPGAPVVLVTRPEPDGAAFAEALRRAVPGPWRALLAPLARIVPFPPPSLPEGAELILTSRNALRALAASGALGDAKGRRAWCVGPATARAAREAGLEPAGEGDGPEGCADALVARLVARGPGAPLMHLRGDHARGAVVERLRLAGLRVDETVIYRQEARPLGPEALAALRGPTDGPLIAPVFSPRAAVLLSEAAAGLPSPRADLRAVALSSAVAGALRLPGARVAVCARPDAAAMIETLAPLLHAGVEPG